MGLKGFFEVFKPAVVIVLALGAGCASPAFSVRVPLHDASYASMLEAATDAMSESAQDLRRVDARGVVRLRGARGVEEVEVVVERRRDETRLEVFISRPELYPPGVGEEFWGRFQRQLNAARKSWLAVESSERSARASLAE